MMKLYNFFRSGTSHRLRIALNLKGLATDYVAVDLRKSSRTFGQWLGVELSEENQRQLWVPEGFAHGFVVTSESADFLYKTTDFYAPAHERYIRWDDPALAIQWPELGLKPLVSAKDAVGKVFGDAAVFA